jgi:hypothetical protein
MAWIEAQSTFVIGVLVFGFCYLLATVILCVALMLSRRAVAQSLKAIAPTTLTPLGVILGLLIGFLAARVWTNLDRANQYVGQEAGALRETILLTESCRRTSARAFGKRSKGILISLSPKSGRRWRADAQPYSRSRWSWRRR